MEIIATAPKTEAQLDGRSCWWCDREDTVQVPIGFYNHVQVFECQTDCRQ